MANALTRNTAATKVARTTTPVSRRTPGRTDEVVNSTGGYVFAVNDKSRLERFLIIGTDGGSYYASEKSLTDKNIKFVVDLIKRDEALVRETVVDVSDNARALKNSPALFTVAALLVYGQDKAAAKEAVAKVARTSTHLFEFAEFIENLGGWGRSKKAAVAAWYTDKTPEALAYQVVKYRQRNGWTHRDLFRLSHPKGVDSRIGNFVLKGEVIPGEGDVLDGFRQMQASQSVKDVVKTLESNKNLPWETIPTQFLKDAEVWKTLFANGQLNGQALIRNIARLARVGAFKDMVFTADVAARLTDAEAIKRARLHPINFVNAAVVFEFGAYDRKEKNNGWYYSPQRVKNWETNSKILAALNDGFGLAFGAVEPSNKRTLVGVDVSGSMSAAASTGTDLTAAQVAAVMAMVIVRTEPYADIRGFADRFVNLNIGASDSLATVMRKVQKHNFGSTDMSLPMEYARQNKIDVDTFAVFTDNEINHGYKPTQALTRYRNERGLESRLAVFGVSATDFTIADPTDRGQMDFVGFDASAPKVFAEFSAGRL